MLETNSDRNRWQFLSYSALAVATLAMLGLITRAGAASDAIKVGILVPISGTFAANGKFASMGTILAAEEVAATYGRPVTTSIWTLKASLRPLFGKCKMLWGRTV